MQIFLEVNQKVGQNKFTTLQLWNFRIISIHTRRVWSEKKKSFFFKKSTFTGPPLDCVYENSGKKWIKTKLVRDISIIGQYIGFTDKQNAYRYRLSVSVIGIGRYGTSYRFITRLLKLQSYDTNLTRKIWKNSSKWDFALLTEFVKKFLGTVFLSLHHDVQKKKKNYIKFLLVLIGIGYRYRPIRKNLYRYFIGIGR